MKRIVVIGLAVLCMGQTPSEPPYPPVWNPLPGVFTPAQERELRRMQNTQWQTNLAAWEKMRSLADSIATNYTGHWSKVGDTLVQHVFDTVIGATATTFTLPVAFTSATSYRVSCTATDNTSPSRNKRSDADGSVNVWSMIRIRQVTSSTFTVSLKGYTDDATVTLTPSAGDSLTCNCVAVGN